MRLQVVKQAGAGTVISPDRSEEFLNAAKSLIENSELRARYARQRARLCQSDIQHRKHCRSLSGFVF